jgi:hypothetical protein
VHPFLQQNQNQNLKVPAWRFCVCVCVGAQPLTGVPASVATPLGKDHTPLHMRLRELRARVTSPCAPLPPPLSNPLAQSEPLWKKKADHADKVRLHDTPHTSAAHPPHRRALASTVSPSGGPLPACARLSRQFHWHVDSRWPPVATARTLATQVTKRG